MKRRLRDVTSLFPCHVSYAPGPSGCLFFLLYDPTGGGSRLHHLDTVMGHEGLMGVLRWSEESLPICCHSAVKHTPRSLSLSLAHLWDLLARAWLSIFVMALRFDVSCSEPVASEPRMNVLVIYTKCLIKSVGSPRINIAQRRWIFATRRGYSYLHLNAFRVSK